MKAVIIEDEMLVAKQLERKIGEIAPDIQIIALLPSLKTARKWFMENAEPDLLFMDVQLSDGISFDLFEYYDLKCPVIFTTAYDEYAIRAFKTNGVDYLLKPVGDDDLRQAIDKCKAQNELKTGVPRNIRDFISMLTKPDSEKGYKEKFIISIRQQWIPVETNNVACFSKDGLYYLHTFNAEKYILDYDSMDEIEAVLNPRQFYRANRQYIVNSSAIHRVTLHENQKLTLFLKAPLKIEIDVSREKAPAFKKWFDR